MKIERGIAIIWLKYSQCHWKQWINMAKSIADKCDVGMILLSVSQDDLDKLMPILSKGFQAPNLKISVYKNRRGSYTAVYLWCVANLGTCRIEPQFVTNWRYELLSIEDIKVIVDEDPPWD